MKTITKNTEHGFALVTGLLMLLVLTLLATVVMRGTTLELAMTTAVTRQEQSLSLADSARSLSRELLISAVTRDPAAEGEVQSGAVAGRPANVPTFISTVASCSGDQSFDALGAGQRHGREGAGNEIRQRGIMNLNENAFALRIQTLNAVPSHINALDEARAACASGKMGMAIVDVSKKIPEGTDVTSTEFIKTLALVGIGEEVGGGYSKVVTLSDIQVIK